MSQSDIAALEQRIAATIEGVYRTGQIELPGRAARRLSNHLMPDHGRMLRDLVAATKPRRTLEIGMGTGLSGLHICWGLAQSAAGGALGRHLAIDPFQQGEFWNGVGLGLRDQAGCTDMFEWCGERDDQALPRLVREKAQFEFALIDGDHRFEAALLDFYYVDMLLPVGGVCLFDDAEWPSVWRVVNFARRHRSYEWVTAVPIDVGPWTRPWGWRLRKRRWDLFRQQGWPLWESITRQPYSFVALRKVAENTRSEAFWAALD